MTCFKNFDHHLKTTLFLILVVLQLIWSYYVTVKFFDENKPAHQPDDNKLEEAKSLRTPSIHCKRAHANPKWFLQSQGWQSIQFHEQSLTGNKATEFPPFLDPLSCQVSSASFLGETNVREGGRSNTSGGSNRLRQLAMGVVDAAAILIQAPIESGCVFDICQRGVSRSLSIYNTDTYSALHESLRKLPLKKYVASDFLPGVSISGTVVNGVRHEDLRNTSFLDNSFDIVISSEVFEHIPNPYVGFQEVYRILQPGGAHVFTVPFVADSVSDIIMSTIDSDGIPRDGPGLPPRFIPPHFHGDTLRPEGIIVFTLFGQEMITNLCKIGFDVETRVFQNVNYGVVGVGSIVFTAWK
jgi:hypothetical protein